MANDKLIEITRHIAGPPRRAPGQRLVMSDQLIRQQRLTKADFKVVRPDTDREIKSPDAAK